MGPRPEGLGNLTKLKPLKSNTDSPNHSSNLYKKGTTTITTTTAAIPKHSNEIMHTIQVSDKIMTLLKEASNIIGDCPTFSEALETILDHYTSCSAVERNWHYNL